MSDEYASSGFQGSLVNDCESTRPGGAPSTSGLTLVCGGCTAADIKDLPPQARDAVTGNYPAPDDCTFSPTKSPIKKFLRLTQNTHKLRLQVGMAPPRKYIPTLRNGGKRSRGLEIHQKCQKKLDW